MTSIVYSGNTVGFTGVKHKKDSTPNAAVLVEIFSRDNNKVIGTTHTNEYGEYFIEVLRAEAIGVVEVRFYGSGYPNKFLPDGDWETVEIVDPTPPSSAMSLALETTSLVVYATDDGTPIEPLSGITLTAKTQNFTPTTFTWTSDPPISTFDAVTSNTNSLSLNDFLTNDIIKVSVKEDSQNLTDTTSIVKLKYGSDAVTMLLTNESHTVPVDGTTEDYSGAYTYVRLYKGTSLISGSYTYNTPFTDGGSISWTLDSSTNKVTVSSLTAQGSFVDISVTYNSNIYVKRFSLSKAAQGITGPGLTYRGAYKDASGVSYDDNEYKRDVVLYNNEYYICIYDGTGGTWNPAHWHKINNWESIATGLFLAEDVIVGRTLTLGTQDGGVHYGIIKSTGVSDSVTGDGYYLSPIDTLGTTKGLFRVGSVTGTELNQGLYWDGVNLIIHAHNFIVNSDGTGLLANWNFNNNEISKDSTYISSTNKFWNETSWIKHNIYICDEYDIVNEWNPIHNVSFITDSNGDTAAKFNSSVSDDAYGTSPTISTRASAGHPVTIDFSVEYFSDFTTGKFYVLDPNDSNKVLIDYHFNKETASNTHDFLKFSYTTEVTQITLYIHVNATNPIISNDEIVLIYNILVTSWDSFIELSNKGLHLFNAPNKQIKFGLNEVEFIGINLTGANLIGSNITGGLIKTKDSGERVVLNGALSSLEFYDENENKVNLKAYYFGGKTFLNTDGNGLFVYNDSFIGPDALQLRGTYGYNSNTFLNNFDITNLAVKGDYGSFVLRWYDEDINNSSNHNYNVSLYCKNSNFLKLTAGLEIDGVITSSGGGAVPPGGSTNQILAKNSNTDYDYSWISSAGGTLITYDSTLNDSTTMPEDVGGITAGTSVGTLRGNSLSVMWDDLLFPTVHAYIETNAAVTLTGISGQTVEVGTTINPNLTATLNRGKINNGDGSYAGLLVGILSKVEYFNNTTLVFTDSTPINTTSTKDFSPYEVPFGTTAWHVDAYYNAGTTTYTDNKGNSETITSIENAKASGHVTGHTANIYGRYYRWHYLGDENSSPTTSVAIRSLNTNVFLSSTNTGSWTVSIPKNTQEFSFYIPDTDPDKTIKVIDTGNLNNDLTSTFVKNSVYIKDAASSNVNYYKYTIFLGSSGYPDDTDFDITVS